MNSARRWRSAGLPVVVLALVATAAASLAFGAKPIPFGDVLRALTDFDGSESALIVRDLRVPRTLLGLAVGSALGLAGALMQGVTRNPLAEPGLLGVNAGASFAVVVGLRWFDVGSTEILVWFAFAGAAIASVVVYLLGSMGRDRATPVKLAIAGAALTYLLFALTTAVLISDSLTLDRYRFWIVGSIAGRGSDVLGQVLPYLVVGALLAVATARGLNTLGMGDDVARALGARIGLVRALAALSIVLLCGASVAAAGPIAFVGLAVPHLARAITGPDHRWLLPWSALLAPILLLGSDILGRVIARPGEVQVGIVTAFVGAPVLIMLVRRKRLASV